MLAALFGAKAKKNAVSVTGSHARINPGDMPSSQLPSAVAGVPPSATACRVGCSCGVESERAGAGW